MDSSHTKKDSKKYLIPVIVFAAVLVGLSILSVPFIKKLNDPLFQEWFTDWVDKLGIGGWFIVFGIQVLQIVVAVIPGEPVELIAGAAYGAFGGLIVCLAGCVAASSLVFLLVRRFGMPLVTRLFGEDRLKKYTFLNDAKKIEVLTFILFLIPGTPKDMLTYVAGLTPIGFARFLAISTFARIPSILTSTIMGDSVLQGNWLMFLLIFLFCGLLGLASMVFKDRILDFFRRKDGKDRENIS
ncbi:TVP38/TMEM64 family protein [Breznakiella homolactica]|uniref:TVP38/TMEM64 family membrane protein n=1 Tax=Breznakiella homolactica TaxID=2798577 RepID=A0A7T7XL80_9SPIR|nr:VTT domain-containing protein [Breznakiella homolactica]QQO08303.1 VTT domain-containing protein [Breznakiella homolactica]